MNIKSLKQDKGFTIIEVVLVLAIAGLIFLIVFLALPQLQASRRDTQRKSDAGRLLAAVENYAGNHSGYYPSGIDATWIGNNIAGDFKDPSTNSVYQIVSTLTDPGDITYNLGSVCNPASDSVTGGQSRDVAVQMKLENGIYCVDNR